jgi:hypothetical protein
MVEHSLGKGEVTGSIPVVGTTTAGRCDIEGALQRLNRFLFGDIIGSIDKRLKVHVQGKI